VPAHRAGSFQPLSSGGQVVLAFGTPEQKNRLLPAVASGESRGTLALIEPQSGYELSKIEMTSNGGANGFFIEGVKLFVPDAHIADWMVCVTRGKGENGGDPGLELLIIDTKSPGISLLRPSRPSPGISSLKSNWMG